MSNTEPPKPPKPPTETKAEPRTAFDPMQYWTTSQQMFRDAIETAHTQASAMADRYAGLDPMGYWASFRDAMGAARTQASAQAGKLDAQYAELESQLVERARTAVATWAQLANDAIAYGAKLSVEARKLGADAAKKMGATA